MHALRYGLVLVCTLRSFLLYWLHRKRSSSSASTKSTLLRPSAQAPRAIPQRV